jgi:hypothetical protein
VNDFGKQVADWTAKAKRATLAVHRESAQRLAHEANVPRAQGGKLPVDTGFMRNSMAASLNGMPSGPGKGRPGVIYTAPVGQPVELVILQARLGGSIWMGWTANYAIYMEARYGFARSAAQNWNYIVASVTNEVRARFS